MELLIQRALASGVFSVAVGKNYLVLEVADGGSTLSFAVRFGPRDPELKPSATHVAGGVRVLVAYMLVNGVSTPISLASPHPQGCRLPERLLC